MAPKTQRRLEAVGWRFWGVTFAVLLGPLWYGAHRMVREDTPFLATLGIGIVAAAVAAGLVTWPVNSVLQHLAKKRHAEQRKLAKRKR